MIRTDDTQKEVGFIKTKHNGQMANIDRIMTKENGQMVKIFEQGFTREQEATALPMETNTKTIGKDLKQYQIYGNSEQRNLPKEYQEVEYIENSGTQYIKTGIVAKDIDEAELVLARRSDSPSQYYLGTRSSNTTAIGYSLYFTNHGGVYYYPMTWDGSGQSVDKNVKFTTKVEFKNGTDKFYYNGTLKKTHTYDQGMYNAGNELYLGAIREDNGGANYISAAKFYSVIMRKDGKEVANYVPCYRKSDTKIGMYDLVSGNFLYSAVSTQFTKGADVVPTPDKPIEIESVGDTIIPSEYQEVEYIESTGTQYVDTGLIYGKDNPKNLTFEYDVSIDYINSSTTYCVIGMGTNYIGVNKTSKYGIYGSGATDRSVEQTIQNNVRQIYKLDNKNGIVSFGNREFQFNFEETSAQSWRSCSYLLFGYMTSGQAVRVINCKKYGVKIYSNNILIRNFIPCYRKSDNVIGMYDIVNGVFYTNAGTGTFLKGNDVNHYKIPVEVKTKNLYGGIFNTKFTLDNPIPANTTIKFSGDNTSSQCYVAIYDIDNVEITNGRLSSTQSDRRVITLTPTKDVYYIKFYNTELSNLCVRIDNSVEYAPYFNETTTIYLNEPLRKIGEYADYIDFKNQKIVRRILPFDLSKGRYEHYSSSSTRTVFRETTYSSATIISPSADMIAPIISNGFVTVSRNASWVKGNISTFTEGDLAVTLENGLMVRDLPTKLNGLYAYLTLVTPTEESITLPSISTAKGGKSIFDILTKVEPSKLKITYKGE